MKERGALFSRLGSSRLRSLSGCARRQVTRRDVALAACVKSAYARPRYAICANVLIATLSGEHERQKQRVPSHPIPSYPVPSRPVASTRRELRSRHSRAAGCAHACVLDTRGCTQRTRVCVARGFSRRNGKTATRRRLPRVTP